MQLLRYNPNHELQKLENDLDLVFGSVWPQFFTADGGMNMYIENDKLITVFSLPHFEKEEVSASVHGDILEIAAEHQTKKETETKRRYLYRETGNQFFKRVTLPSSVLPEEITAKFKDGVLTVTTPYTPEQTTTQLHIE